jgi:hypothetical protein
LQKRLHPCWRTDVVPAIPSLQALLTGTNIE